MHDLGAGLTAGPEMQAFMEKYDLTKTPYSIDITRQNLINSKGDTLRTSNIPQVVTTWNVLYHHLRANFDGLKSAYCEPPAQCEGDGMAQFLDGCTVSEVKPKDGRMAILYHDLSGTARSLDADFVIGADGTGSTVRRFLLPNVDRIYAYAAWRGTVPAAEISPESWAAMVVITLCAIEDGCALSYLMPGKNGSIAPEDQLYKLDKNNHEHRFSVPLGMMRFSTINEQKFLARELLPPYSEELKRKTAQPYIQAITDMMSPQTVFWDGKVVLVGDAVVCLRPLTGLGVNQAARSAALLLELLDGKMGTKEWETSVLEYAKTALALGSQREGAIFNVARNV